MLAGTVLLILWCNLLYSTLSFLLKGGASTSIRTTSRYIFNSNLSLAQPQRLLYPLVAMASTSKSSDDARQDLSQRITAALAAHKRGELDEALSAYELVIPDVLGIGGKLESTLRNNAAAIYMNKGDYDAAKTHFMAAIQCEPNDPQSHFNLAVILTSKFNEHGKAIRHCGLAIKLDPKHVKAHHLMGNILQNLGKDEQAQNYFVLADNLARGGGGEPLSSTATSSAADADNTGGDKWERFHIMFARVGDQFSTTDVTAEGLTLTLQLECISERPLIFKATNVMSVTECAHIMQRATDKLEKSFVMGGGSATTATTTKEADVTGETVFSSGGSNNSDEELYRSSYNAWLHADEVATALQRRFAAVTGLPLQLFQQKSEELQVVKYDLGGQFKVHHDSSAFQPRLLTALLYLTNVPIEHGGGTWFPHAGADAHGPESVESAIAAALRWEKLPPIDRPGVTVTPSQGDAIIFFNHLRNGELDPLAVHAGLPILPVDDPRPAPAVDGNDVDQGGKGAESTRQKWIANYWVEYDERILFE